jgi:broad specificity phosphatase PhoE
MNDSVLVRLVLLRHGQVASHRGDVPLTDAGVGQATDAGTWFAKNGWRLSAFMHGGTTRARPTAAHFKTAYDAVSGAADSAVTVDGNTALRNPDLYLGGFRVNMVSSPEAFAEQVPSLTPEEIGRSPWYREFLTSKDRVGFWAAHANPPGETAQNVGRRIEAFARSLADVPAWHGGVVLGTTHSPVLRSVALTFLGHEPGEPSFLHGYSLSLMRSGALHVAKVEPEIDTAVMTN